MANQTVVLPRAARSVARLLRSQPLRSDTARICKRCIATVQQRNEQDGPDSLAFSERAPFMAQNELFSRRHIGPSPEDETEMLKALDPPVKDLEDFIQQSLPQGIRQRAPTSLADAQGRHNIKGRSEKQVQSELVKLAKLNTLSRNFIGAGYYGTTTPPVITRNILENPAWYTSYTPYQAEISQGRLESLLNFQTLVTDLTGLAIANASVLDEGTAAAEAMTLSMNALSTSRLKAPGKTFVVSSLCHPQTIAVLEARAAGFGISIVVGDILENNCQLVKDQGSNLVGVLAQYPDTTGGVFDFQSLSDVIHAADATFCVATDLLALTLLKAPGEFGADVAFGSAQRFGVPMGFGGPHAAFFACNEKHKRKIPGRLVGVSKDRLGNRALRLALQTREQHIRREKATSNICTAQALLANMSAFYAIYHGPDGLKDIAHRIWAMARFVQILIEKHSTTLKVVTSGLGDDGLVLFDTVTLEAQDTGAYEKVLARASKVGVSLRTNVPGSTPGKPRLGFSIDEATGSKNLVKLASVLGIKDSDVEAALQDSQILSKVNKQIAADKLQRSTPFLTHPVFNQHHSETELLRYMHHLQSKDLSLIHSMIPLGSCTMKLNGTTEMLPVSNVGWSALHPFASGADGYKILIERLSKNLATITGMDAVSLQPNSGAQGEFAGLRVIEKYHSTRGQNKRKVCLIPVSAHGTNPASAAMAGMKVVSLKCDTKTGNLDLKDLKEKCEKHKDDLAAIMVTYPSTFGVFEPAIKEVCQIVHDHGGQVYMDGANLNAQIGLCNPGEIGADVCHLNLHKTFCIPHGGGGPGVGPIAVKNHLQPFLPTHPLVDPHPGPDRARTAISPVSSAPWGSALILPISYAYIQLMGSEGLKHGTEVALLNANYIMSRLRSHYPIVYTNANGRCAHEFILDARGFKETSGVEAIDIAKRLQDYGFHAPTMSWPVANTLMIEPTESESKEELDRFCDALIEIRKEIRAIEDGEMPRQGNVLKMAPHPQQDLMRNDWDRPYTREQAAYPLPWLREKKFWPTVARVDDAYGDTNLFCTCTPVEGYEQEGLTGHEAPMPT
ncbi:glycine dehydrogenase [Cladophialophora psammophila CBS 110553]|uniref:Glycine cleavage system P protein n=1 Tax=Cladophialophora psammophila CBS 110553 TaxID=1182543 RepID=W9WM03_9EURO|nr:glycine dehydrogenase [Cladophialophora psammophila CBS 110553]EXJ68898.1 glycine dehydrogenase [Cladophialophora psammophila CBS 110553]